MIELLMWCAACLPSIPAPKVGTPPPPVHRFYDRTAKIELSVALTAMSFDTAQTCHNLAVGGRETFLPTENCAGVVGFELGLQATQELTAYALHRHGHHAIERLVRLYSIGVNTNGIAWSHAHGAW